MIFAIGTPGQKLRMYLQCKDRDTALASLLDGEALIELKEQGDYTDLISEDGLSTVPYQKTPEDMEQEEAFAFSAKRRDAYPSIEDQLDILYHGGLDAWRDVIAKAKSSVPKPETNQLAMFPSS